MASPRVTVEPNCYGNGQPQSLDGEFQCAVEREVRNHRNAERRAYVRDLTFCPFLGRLRNFPGHHRSIRARQSRRYQEWIFADFLDLDIVQVRSVAVFKTCCTRCRSTGSSRIIASLTCSCLSHSARGPEDGVTSLKISRGILITFAVALSSTMTRTGESYQPGVVLMRPYDHVRVEQVECHAACSGPYSKALTDAGLTPRIFAAFVCVSVSPCRALRTTSSSGRSSR